MTAGPTVKQVVNLIEHLAPRSLALPGDPVGLQYGNPDRPVRKLMLSLDATLDTVGQAVQEKADLLITHHPLLFEPLTSENVGKQEGKTLERAILGGLAVYSAHTNLDACPNGINAVFADLLDLGKRKFLQQAGSDPYKMVIFVPEDHLEKVKETAFEAGAGQIGSYSRCSFTAGGEGTFFAEKGAAPVIGTSGRDERVPERRLEVLVPSDSLRSTLDAVVRAHPYEEPAIDIYPTVTNSPRAGIGIAGELPRKVTVGQVATIIASRLKPSCLRLVGNKGRSVKVVAVCAGSGASLLDAAIESGAQLYITGDVKYHDARKAQGSGINILDTGHYAPEKYGFTRFGKLLEGMLARNGFKVTVTYARESDPFRPI